MADQVPAASLERPHGAGLRAQFVSAVAQATAETKMALGPACYDTIDRAQTFVLNGTVEQLTYHLYRG